MTTPHDARPVAVVELDSVGGVNPVWTGSQERWAGSRPPPGTVLYTATDYDALRAEVERLRSPLSEAQHHAIREMARSVDTGEASILTAERWQAICALFQEQDSIIRARGDLIEQATARAEAAEASLSKAREYATDCIDELLALNEQVYMQIIDRKKNYRQYWYNIEAANGLRAALNDQGQGNG